METKMRTSCKLWFGLVVCLFVVTIQVRALPLLPQQDDFTFEENSEEEEEEEEVKAPENIDDVYDEEKKTISEEEKEFDKDDRKEAAERTKVASALGLRNYSSHAIEELIMTYLTGRAPERQTTTLKPKPKRRRRTTTTTTIIPDTTSTRKYKIKKANPSSNGNIMPVVIKLPHGNNGSIAINIPIDMMSMKPHSPASNSSLDEQQVLNIQTSIMKALLITEKLKSMFMSTTTNSPLSHNNLESIEPDNKHAHRQQQSSGENETMKKKPGGIKISVGPPGGDIDEPSLDIQSPLPVPGSTIPVKGAVTEDPLKGFDEFMAQIRNKMPEYIWQGILNLSKTNYGEMAVDAVECAIFRHCPDHTSLGENIKYLI